MKKLQTLAIFVLTSAIVALPATAREGNLRIKLKGYEEVPAVSSAATGRFRAHIDESAKVIEYKLSYEGLEGEVRQAHIHFGQTSVNGGISIFLCQTPFNPDPTGLAPVCVQTGAVNGVIQADNIIGPAEQGIEPQNFAELVEAIRAGVAYVNVHSLKFPAGEVRGQFK